MLNPQPTPCDTPTNDCAVTLLKSPTHAPRQPLSASPSCLYARTEWDMDAFLCSCLSELQFYSVWLSLASMGRGGGDACKNLFGVCQRSIFHIEICVVSPSQFSSSILIAHLLVHTCLHVRMASHAQIGTCRAAGGSYRPIARGEKALRYEGRDVVDLHCT